MTTSNTIKALLAAVICGLLFAPMVEFILGRMGLEFAGLFSSTEVQLRSALAWWATVIVAFVGGYVVAFALTRMSWQIPQDVGGVFAAVAVVLAAGAVFALAAIGHDATLAASATVGKHMVASLAAMTLSALMAALGAYFATRRRT